MYRYTGYSVSGIDVFIWVLLTAGSIGFPMLVLTICCIKHRVKRKSNALINSESIAKINQMNQTLKTNFIETNQTNERYNHVRFNEDTIKSKKGVKESEPKLFISEPTNIQDFRNFKQMSENLVVNKNSRPNEIVGNNYVNPNDQSTLPSILPSIPLYTVADSYRDGSNSSGVVNSSYRRDESFENLYSQIPNRKQSNRNEYEDDQPVYMNTNYDGQII
ncbi:unnamed protein product [Brachionus calyciflorus]|uniref:Uncharacterized protein n=1 Tax=Brachionus calyciflorus TaxID=104777 RepID=A0A813M3K0_9BILA|nr:unnamed protein product [Brachionus calyciflorus]